MKTIQVKDKQFRLYIPEEKIKAAVKEVAVRLNEDLSHKDVVLLCILKGSFVFFADLVRELNFDPLHLFLRLSSYSGVESSGDVRQSQELPDDLKGKTVLVVEDIVDSGLTIDFLIRKLYEKGVKEVKIATFLFKPEALKYDVKPDYSAFEIPSDFVVGYGLDYDEHGRNLKDLYILNE